MNFDEWSKEFEYDFSKFGTNVDSARVAWDTCKEEILKIIFLNTKQNGTAKLDLKKTLEEIEKL